LVQGVTSAVNAFNDLPGAAKSSATALLGITAITGGSLWFGSKVIRGIGDTKQALKDLGVTSDTTSRAMTGLRSAALITGTFFALSGAVEALHVSMDKSLPSTEKLTTYLLNLGDAQAAQAVAKGIGDLGGALDTLDNPGAAESVNNLYAKIPLIGSAAKDSAALIPVLGANLYDADQKSRDAAASISALDGALANIVTSGSPEQAAAVLADLSAKFGLTDAQQKSLAQHLPQYSDAVAAAANQTQLAGSAAGDTAGALDGLATATGAAATAASDQAQAVADSVKAMQDQADAAVQAFDAVTSYRQAMKDAAAQAKKNEAGIQGNSKAALANSDALSQLVGAWNAQDQTVTDNIGKFKAARENFITTATAMGVSKDAATKLWQEMAKIPTSKVIDVNTPGIDQAQDKARTLKQILDSLHSKNIDIALNYQTFGNKPHAPTPGTTGSPRTSAGLTVITPRTSDLSAESNNYALRALQGLAKSSDDASHSAKGLKAQLAEAEQHLKRMTRAADDAHKAFDSLKSQKSDLESGVVGSLSHDAFRGGLSDFEAQTAADTADAQAVLAALQTLVANGLDPHSDLFKRLSASGNVSLIQEFAALTRDQLAGEAASFAAGQTALTATGQFAGNAAFNDLVKAQAKVTNHLDDTVHQLAQQVNHLEHAIDQMAEKVKQAAHDGTKSGSHEGSESGSRAAADERRRRTAAAVRTGGGSR
jgi:methyl-accepting chemotaxis protein